MIKDPLEILKERILMLSKMHLLQHRTINKQKVKISKKSKIKAVPGTAVATTITTYNPTSLDSRNNRAE